MPELMYYSSTTEKVRLTLAVCVVITVVGIYMTLAVDITDGRGLITKSVVNSCQRRAR